MDRATAQRLVGKLRCVTEARGATPAEARLAAEKASSLEERFGVRVAEAPRGMRAERAPRAGAQGARPSFVIFDEVAKWEFDVATGRGSSNVKVHRYENRANWRIEIEL